jgi:hypothetical protein
MAEPGRRMPKDTGEEPTTLKPETDERFPSGEWEGFFLMSHTGLRRHMMELLLSFSQGRLKGEGRDFVGDFLLRGRYDVETGRCIWNKKYVNKHEVNYDGFNEGKGIFGKWEIQDVMTWHGGFLIWPKGMGDPTRHRRRAEADVPIDAENRGVTEADLAPVSAASGESVMGALDKDVPF